MPQPSGEHNMRKRFSKSVNSKTKIRKKDIFKFQKFHFVRLAIKFEINFEKCSTHVTIHDHRQFNVEESFDDHRLLNVV